MKNGEKYVKTLEKAVSEKIRITINGVEQGMFIKGKDCTNPVLLFLNGGPGIPDYFMRKNNSGIEDLFTVCYWDYRGTGLSVSAAVCAEDCTTKQYILDAISVTDYLRERFKQDQIYLLGHSFGTYIGLLTVQAAPEKYRAYIAMSQISNQPKSELLAYNTMKAIYVAKGARRMVRKLKSYETDTPNRAWLRRWFSAPERDRAMHELGGGTMGTMKSVITGIFIPVLCCRDYTLAERLNIWKGKAIVQKTQVAYDRMEFVADISVPSIDIPVYFFSGRHDLTCCYVEQKAYFKKLLSPAKGFYTFEHSAHSPLYEEPERALDILRKDVLNGEFTLADTE